MNKIVLNIEGMTCSACSNGLEKYLNKQKGIKEASVNSRGVTDTECIVGRCINVCFNGAYAEITNS